MMKNDNLDGMIDRIISGLPTGLSTLGRDLEQNVRAAVKSALRKMDLVTREEFDIQHDVLIRTRSRLEALEKQVAKLEGKESED